MDKSAQKQKATVLASCLRSHRSERLQSTVARLQSKIRYSLERLHVEIRCERRLTEQTDGLMEQSLARHESGTGDKEQKMTYGDKESS